MNSAPRIELIPVAVVARLRTAFSFTGRNSSRGNAATVSDASGPLAGEYRTRTSLQWLSDDQGIMKRPELFAIVLVIFAAALRVQGTVDADVSWQLWIAERLHHGARLYRDIIEVNPPLWFWLAVPVERIADLTGIRSDAVMIAAVASAVMISLIGTSSLTGGIAQRRRSVFLLYAAAMLFVMPWMHIGQREQLVLIGALPYSALIAGRRSGNSIDPRLALAIGAGAAIGFLLKHYFVIVPALFELWLVSTNRKSWRILRPEIIAAVAIGVSYCAAIFICTPDYFTTVLPLIREAYGATGAPHFIEVFQPPIWIAFLIILFIAVQVRRRVVQFSALTTALLIASLGFGAAYFIQHKGWLYHSIPFVGCAALALASLLAERPLCLPSLRILGPVLLSLPLVVTLQESRSNPLPGAELTHSVSDLSAGDGVGFIATEPALAWSVTLQHHLRYASRYYGFWMLRAILQGERNPVPDPKLEKLRVDVIHQTVVDFRCIAPRRIIVARPPQNSTDSTEFDILPFFLNDPEFAAMFAHYRPIKRGETLETYNLVIPLGRPRGCRSGV